MSRTKSSFLANMSHELRTPLNAIIGLTDMLVNNAARFGTDKALEPLRRVHRAGTHLLELINQVLDLSKIEAGKLELNLETVECPPLWSTRSSARHDRWPSRTRTNCPFECPPNLPSIEVDAMRLRQILLNLLSNACKFTKDGNISLQVIQVVHRRPSIHRIRRHRHRHRHDARANGTAVRGILARRRHDRASIRRNRARSGDHAPPLSDDGRRRHR